VRPRRPSRGLHAFISTGSTIGFVDIPETAIPINPRLANSSFDFSEKWGKIVRDAPLRIE